MTKLNRLTAKIFGETASTTNTPKEIGQFGSAKVGTYNATGDVATIQSLPAWSNGWIDAVTPTDQFPPLPEMTGVHKVLSYQNAYLLQQGIPEWDSGTTYYTNGFCSKNGDVYVSQSDNNLNNDPENDTVHWQIFQPTVPPDQTFSATSTNAQSGVSILGLLKTIYPVGCVYLTTNSTCPLSSLFGTWSLVSSGKALWTGYGSNGGTTIAAGLPNITGEAAFWGAAVTSASGAFYLGASNGTISASSASAHRLGMDASGSSSIYGSSSTVQPPAYVVNAFRRTA